MLQLKRNGLKYTFAICLAEHLIRPYSDQNNYQKCTDSTDFDMINFNKALNYHCGFYCFWKETVMFVSRLDFLNYFMIQILRVKNQFS